jgi:hypothetical protein
MLFIPSDTVLDLCSMGTLFAFVLVSGGVLKMQVTPNAPRGKFRTPYLNGKWTFPIFLSAAVLLIQKYSPETIQLWLGKDGNVLDQAPILLFWITSLVLAVLAFKHNLSLIPLLGLVFCLYMMAQIPVSSWFWFLIWLLAGLVIYFGYSYRHSKLSS